MAEWLQFLNKLLQEIFWDLEMSLSEEVTCGEGLLSNHTETVGSLENKTKKKIQALTLCMKHADKVYLKVPESLSVFSFLFPFQGRKVPCHPPAGGNVLLTQEKETSRAGLWGHQY